MKINTRKDDNSFLSITECAIVLTRNNSDPITFFQNYRCSHSEMGIVTLGIDDHTGRTGQAFGLVFASAGATAIGSLAVFYPRLAKFATAHVLASSLGFATGVMVYISFVDIYNKSIVGFLDQGHDEDEAFLYTTLSFFGGIVAMKVWHT